MSPPPSAFAQQRSPEKPDLAAREAQFEEAFKAALDSSEDEPLASLQAWGVVLMQAAMLDRLRAMAQGAEGSPPSPRDSLAAADRVLERWQRLRPDSGGPDLFRAFRIQDEQEKRAAEIALLARYPDDPLVVWQAANELRHSGQVDHATEVVEGFVARHPDRQVAYRLLAENAMANATRLAEALQRWAEAVPGDPEMINLWMASVLPRQEPAATEAVLRDFFAGSPAGGKGLAACLQVARQGAPAFADAAQACVGRIAADPETPPAVAERATSALAGMAAATGDRTSLLSALQALEPQARVRALIAAARGLQMPERCGEALDLLAVAVEALGDDASAYPSAASALRGCSAQPAARQLFLELLRRAPTEALPQLLYAWGVERVNGVLQGELPGGATGVLEDRLQREPGSPELFRGLGLAYRLAGEEEKRFDLLRRWQRAAPSSFMGEQAAGLASGLMERDRPRAAIEVLERQLAARFEPTVAELLWELYGEVESAERAERFAGWLTASGDRWRVPVGHWLAARSAFGRKDFGAAESQYWQALAGEHPRQEVAIELLATIAWRGEKARLEPTARRICGETKLVEDPSKVAGCAADLLTRAGSGDAASAFLAAAAEALPADVDSLRQLASTAQEAGQAEIAERALRRILELDPRDVAGWTQFGVFLEKQGRTDEVVDLLDRSREAFSPPPIDLYRAAGRALTAAHQPRRAADVLLEARSTLPDTQGGEWSRSWIDHELGEAYRALGQASATSRSSAPSPSPAFTPSEPPPPPTGTAAELRLAADALYSGQGGRYDPDAARQLYARAAAMGDLPATFRLALLRQLHPTEVPPGEPSASELYRRSAPAVEARAEEGEAYAQYLVGTAASIGLGGDPDPAVARRWLEAAAAQGESWAWHNLAWMAEHGRGFGEVDLGAALASYRRASEAGNTVSMVDFARLTLSPEAAGASCDEGLNWLERSARTGNARAASWLGKVLFYGRGRCVARDAEASLPWLGAAAATNQPGGAYDLGLALILTGGDEAARARGEALLEEDARQPDVLAVETLALLDGAGVGVPRDPMKARRLMAEAARLGSDGFPRLQSQAALSDVFGDLLAEATKRLEALAERSDPAAAALLARLYVQGLGGEIDPDRIVALARQGAAGGEASAMRILSSAYQRGEGVERDEAEGRRWQQRCAAAGNSFCMMFLAHDLMDGEGGERDVEGAVQWLRRSASEGNWWAVGDLGHLYDEGGHGVARDEEEAATWKRRLADLGDPEATGWLLYHGYL